ncbi:hypothetical protein D3C81_1626650 [compost metagenome]
MNYQVSHSLFKESGHLNYDPKEHTMNAYIIARKTKNPEDALQATKIFALSNFFIFTENLTHNENLTSKQIRSVLRKKILEFAQILDSNEEEFEKKRISKIRCINRSNSISVSKEIENVLNILLN